MAARTLTLVGALALAAMVGAGSPAQSGEPARAKHYMIATANPHASQAGLAMLRRGGSAVDAAIAAQLVLNLVEPQSSGIGGGAFMLAYDAEARAVHAYDGRETAPAAVTPDLFLTADGEPMGFYDAVIGGRAVGVPGLVAMLEMAHRRHGRLPWAALFEPAITLAEAGFAVSPRLHQLIAGSKGVDRFDTARAYFFTAEGAPKPVGTRLFNPAFAATLRAIAAGGAKAFYEGDIADAMVAAIAGAEGNPGVMTGADLAAYEANDRAAVCRPYRQWRVCGMGPPSSGGVTTLGILGLLEQFDLAALTPGSVEAVHLISEASRLAYADRARYLADSDFVAVPVRGLLDRGYLAERAALINPWASMGAATAGTPPYDDGMLRANDPGTEQISTTHLSVIDGLGNAVAMTSSVESAFGSRLMVRGFMLNNQLTDFSFRSAVDGVAVANRVAPGKRPRSSMAPTLVFDQEGELLLAVGSPGGSRIIGYVTQVLVAMLDWDLDAQQALDLPHHVNRNGPVDLEAGTALAGLEVALASRGHEVRLRKLTSGLHAVAVTAGGLEGGADPRREGVALGD
ncbi:MAG: gamma-glutamyltransferase [Alphaproteobacteria bacterium]